MDRYKIIIVEDDRELRDNISDFMNLNGFSTRGVSTAMDFFAVIENESFDLAVVDIGLPDRNDFKIIKYLRENTQTRIVILTARGRLDDRLSGYSAGADAYFVKPADCWELKACISSILDRYKAEGQNNDAADEWSYNPAYLTLSAPSGKLINLTTKEGIVLSILIEKKDCNVERNEIFARLNQKEGLNYDNSALDILMARLRKRVKEKTGSKLPVRTVRSVGYCFYASVRIN